jgi:hypothetical protein
LKKTLLVLIVLAVSSLAGLGASGKTGTFLVRVEIQHWYKKVQKVLFGYSGEGLPNLPMVATINEKVQGQFALPSTIPDRLLNNPISSANLYDGIHPMTECGLDSQKAEASLVHVYFLDDSGLYFDAKTNKIFPLSPGSDTPEKGFSQKHVLFYASKAFSANIKNVKCPLGEVSVDLKIKKGWNIIRSVYTVGLPKDKFFVSMDYKIVRDHANTIEREDAKSGPFHKAYEQYLK